MTISVLRFPSAPFKLIWALDITYLSLLMGSYLLRSSPRAHATGVAEHVVPFLMILLNGLLFSQRPTRLSLAPIGVPLMILGGVIACLAAWSLRGEFSIMVEARGVVQRGIYRFARHPMYFSNFLALLGATCLRLSPVNVILYVSVVLGQWYRARLEERKLEACCPEYAAYRRRVPMFELRIPRGLRRYPGRPTLP